MFEVRQGPELLQGAQVERCLGVTLRWVEREGSPHHRSLLEMAVARRSVRKQV